MLTKTTMSALRALVHLAQQEDRACQSPRRIGEVLGESPTYMAKALRHLVKAGILRAERGVLGGVRLARMPEDITMLAVVEACQGALVGDFCQSSRPASTFCGFHRAALEFHTAITGVLSRWTIAGLLDSPEGQVEAGGGVTCVMSGLSVPRRREGEWLQIRKAQ
jgi:Rrf2 family protein